MQMKTPMQELIEWLDDYPTEVPTINKSAVKAKARKLLEKEKEQIEDAHIEGQRVFDDYPHTQWTNDQAEAYYKKTYNKQWELLNYNASSKPRAYTILL